MTTYVNFAPSVDQPFQFVLTLDGVEYNAIITWPLFAQRWYVNLFSLDGTRVVSRPLIASSGRLPLTLTTEAGSYFASAAATDDLIQVGKGSVVLSVNVLTGTWVAGKAGSVLALTQPALATGTDTFAQISNDINILAGYFSTSALVYRPLSSRFEISP